MTIMEHQLNYERGTCMNDNKIRILIADDDPEIRNVLHILLSAEGYEVCAVSNGQEAVEQASLDIDLYILDVDMPVLSGFAAGTQIRKQFYAPLLFLTAYSGESDKMMGFSAGADDYLVKPFSNFELLLRIRALLRRYHEYSPPQEKSINCDTITYKDLILHPDSQSVSKNNEVIALTYTEYRILELFLTHPKKIYSLDNIYQSVWEEDAVGDSTIMVHIKNLRRKLGDNSRNPQYIRTAWGKGYYAD